MVKESGIDIYFERIKKIKLLTRKQEKELFKKLRKKKTEYEEIRNQIMEANFRLVVSIAKNFINRSHSLEFLDLIEEGNIGLIKAINKFDINKGCKFSTYATYWIMQKILRAIADKSPEIQIPAGVYGTLLRIKKIINSYGGEIKSYEELEKLAQKFKVPAHLLKSAFEVGSPCSLDLLVGEDKNIPLIDLIKGKDKPIYNFFEEESNRLTTEKDLDAALKEKEKLIISHRFGFCGHTPKTLKEIGKILGVSRERVRQIEKIAIKKLKRFYERQKLKKFVKKVTSSKKMSRRFLVSTGICNKRGSQRAL